MGKKDGILVIIHIFSATPLPSLLCLVVLSLSGYSASSLQYCMVKTKKRRRSPWKRRRVCPCVKMLRCLCTIFVFPLCLKRPKEKHPGRDVTGSNRKTTQVDSRRSNSELCPYVCDICRTCIYFKSIIVDFTTMSVCFKSCHSVFVEAFYCSPNLFIKLYKLCKEENTKKWKIYQHSFTPGVLFNGFGI